MPNRYRRVKWNNIGTGAKVRIRRSIWLAELQDFGTITDGAVDLPTSGATHRGNLGAKSGTREYVDLSTVNDLTVVDTQDHGAISDTAITAVAWKLIQKIQMLLYQQHRQILQLHLPLTLQVGISAIV